MTGQPNGTARRRPGTDDGVCTELLGLPGRSEPSESRPSASIAFDDDATAKVVVFEFAAGQELREHAAAHPILVQVVRGAVEFDVSGREISMGTGDTVHLTSRLRHAVRATEPTTLTVTMLLGGST